MGSDADANRATVTVVVRPLGALTRQALWRAVDDAQADDPLAPVTVCVPSLHAGLSLRRELGGRPERPALVNVRFMALDRLAELLGAPALAARGREPLTGALEVAAVRTALARSGGAWESIASHPATESRLLTTFTDLRRASPAALRTIAGRSPRAHAVVELYRHFQTATAAWYHTDDLFDAAREVVAAPGDRDAVRAATLRDLGAIVVYLPRDISPASSRFLTALCAVKPVTVIVGSTGDPEVDAAPGAPLSALRAALGSEPSADAPPSPSAPPLVGTHIVAAPEPDDELRAVVREIVRRAEQGVPLHRMAVLYRNAEPYARVAHERLGAAGIPFSGTRPRALADTAAGRTLLGALALADDDFRRDDVIAWLAAAPVLEPGRGAAPTARWDTISRRARVVAGPDKWAQRLAAFIAGSRHDSQAAETEGDDRRVDRARRDADDALRLATFVADLAGACRPPGDGGWPELAHFAVELLARLLGSPRAGRGWPDDEITAYETVRAAAANLVTLDAIGESPGPRALRRALESELAEPAGRTGRFGVGVFVGSVGSATGTVFDTVFLVGMVEGAFPPPTRDDSLLPDRERADGALPLRAARVARERAAFLGALAAGERERVLCFARADSHGRRSQRPSRWLLDTATRHAGRPVVASALESIDAPWLTVIPSMAAGIVASPAGSLQEHDLASLDGWLDGQHDRDLDGVTATTLTARARRLADHPLVEADPVLRSGRIALAARHGPGFTPYDGLVAGIAAEHLGSVDRPLSPTSLETWATCPRRYLLGSVLRLRVDERPEDRRELDGATRGVVVHEILAGFVAAAPRRAPTEPWSADERGALRARAEVAFDTLEGEGRTGHSLLWRLERRRLLADLDAVLDTDEWYRAAFGVVPVDTELAFGLGLGVPGDRPVVMALGAGAPVAFRGRIDRVDRAPDGSGLAVADYKTGKPDKQKEIDEDPLARGTHLQLAVYALAARQHFGDLPVRASYWFTREHGPDGIVGFDLTGALHDRAREVLGLVTSSITAGLFPARPGKPDYWGYENCSHCDFDALCPPDRAGEWERARTDPRLAGYVALAEGTP